MLYAFRKPQRPLGQFIDLVWLYDGYVPTHSKERVLPDGTMELLIDLTDTPKHTYCRDDFSRVRSFKHSWISGKQREHIVIEAAPDSAMMGVHFKPGGIFPFLHFPLSELTDQVVQLDLIWGRDIELLREQILSVDTPQRRFDILEAFLFHRARDHFKTNRSVDYALALLMRSPHGMAIRELAGRIGITQKHLISQFDKFVGLKPKLFGRICKFQQALNAIHRSSGLSWANLAAHCGYYDQPHFIREFQTFAGMTPAGYARQKGEYPNFVPIRST